MLVCTEQQYHASLMRDFPGLVPHSRLGKWLFLAEADNEEFEQVAERIISAVLRCDPRIGVYPTSKKKLSINQRRQLSVNQKLSPGNTIDPFVVRTIHGKEVSIPDREGRWTHLQFRRFAGCPICNLHLQTFIRNHHDIEQAGIREVVFFHSNDASLLPYQGHFPFDVVGDPAKKFYKQFGVESSPLAILNPSAWGAMVKGNLARDKPPMKGFPENGPFGLPADFLLSPEGKLVAVHYGSHAYDQWSVEDVLAKLKTR